MGVVPPTPNFTAGEFPTAAKLNQLQTALNFLLNPPRAQVQLSAAQNHATTATYIPVAFDAESVDTDGMHDPVTLNTRLTIQTPGKYQVGGQVLFAFNATGRRIARLVVNNTGAGALGAGEAVPFPTPAGTVVLVEPMELSLVAGDYIEMQAYQASGGALAYGLGMNTFMYARWIGV